MTDKDERTDGKTRLDMASYGADLSGRDFENVYLESAQTLSHSFLNGSSFKKSIFLGGPIDQTELAEAHITECSFTGTDFTGSSFIGATVEHTRFHNCTFADGEWRKSRFTNVSFKDCNFNYTTVNLCVFDNCEFHGDASKTLDNRSVNYNVFTRCRFGFASEDDMVIANNFGLASKGLRTSLTNYGGSISLEEICIKSSSGATTISELVDAIENEFGRRHTSRLKTLRLEFVSNIISGLAKINKISALSLSYLESFFLALAQSAGSEADILAAMGVVINLRSLLFDFIERAAVDSELVEFMCQTIDIRYERTYNHTDANTLARLLGELTNNNANTFIVSHFAAGSTLIELTAGQVVTVGAILTALNFALRQVNTILVQAQHIRINVTKLLRSSSKPKQKSRKKKQTSRVPALQRSRALSREALLLRHAVATHGRDVVLLDDETQRTVHYVSNR